MTHLDEKALLPCPFCGKEPIFTRTVEDDNFDRWFHVRCEECAIEIGDEYRSDAINTWNRRASPALPSSPVSELVGRDAAGETVFGLRVAAYRETHPEHGDRYGHAYSEHWSTPNYNHPNVKVERLFTEDQLRDTLTTLSVRNAELERGIDRLAAYIMENVPGEPSENQGAVDTAIRLLGKNAELEREVKRLREALSGCFCPRPVNAREYGFTVGECVAAGECGCCDGETLRSLSTSPRGGEHE
ncbi:Lar family restriction alleviation protein [Aquamicrobium zhengzhouense]|uniref:Restriction alleviation protein, Lar family n=1 Tax=Aquamicrobium zhengzhouense TaxID=2781738 RepID=A0ABS0SAK4_9HYPH|nr:Lar family restriction alleviation protein [Aquamicrobium zhengzhouense]MBI1620314.1 restriction alleviation protein, Lar family [Aquamicrobium zhengzhouense]